MISPRFEKMPANSAHFKGPGRAVREAGRSGFHIVNVDHQLQLKIDNKIYAARWPSACCAV